MCDYHVERKRLDIKASKLRADAGTTAPNTPAHVCSHCEAGLDQIEYVQFPRLSYNVIEVDLGKS